MIRTIYLLSFAIVFSFFASCNQKKESIDNALVFETLKLDTIVHLFNDTVYPKCSFEMVMQYPTQARDTAILAQVKHFMLTHTLGEQYAQKTAKSAAHDYMMSYVEDYLTLEKDLHGEKKEFLMGASFNYVEMLENKVVYNAHNLVSMTVDAYTYTGGAHGMSGQSNYVFSIKDDRTLMLTDLFEESSYRDIAKLIVGKIAADKHYEDPNMLYDDGYFSIDEVLPTDNFYVDATGITWTYKPYEIAAYSTGQTTVTLSWITVEPYLIADSPVLDLATTHAQ